MLFKLVCAVKIIPVTKLILKEILQHFEYAFVCKGMYMVYGKVTALYCILLEIAWVYLNPFLSKTPPLERWKSSGISQSKIKKSAMDWREFN